MQVPSIEITSTTPLCVDCDGTLIRTDLLHESLLALVRQAPGATLQLPGQLLRGKAHFKAFVAGQVDIDTTCLPFREEVLEIIRQARQEGRKVLLVTAASESIAQRINQKHGLFDEVLATTARGPNLSGHSKAAALVQRFGAGGFDYVGDSWKDIPVWEASRRAYAVTSSPRLLKRLQGLSHSVSVIDPGSEGVRSVAKALRLHQWAKNALVFVPLFVAHAASDLAKLLDVLLGFLAFGLCASAVYVLNDLMDLESDRQHPRKRNRPFASGALPVSAGMFMATVSLLSSVGVSFAVGTSFQVVLAAYFLLTLAYSLRLKEQVMVDVILLATLYTSRIIAGAAAASIMPSFWLLAFSMFIFLSLALLKRYTELRQQEAAGALKAAGRGYLTTDLPVLLSLGSGSSLVAVLVFALFINAPTTLAAYREPTWLWLIPMSLLYWCSRVWLKAHRGQVHDDPVVFALKDWQSLLLLVVSAGVLVVAH